MHAFLLVGNNTTKEIEDRLSRWNISSWDVIRTADNGTVGIEEIRSIISQLSLSPRNSPAKAAVIDDMERLTTEAQNALLKTIEEPPPHVYIIGTTTMPDAIVPTILSRMSIVTLRNEKNTTDATLLRRLLQASPGKRMQLVDPYVRTADDAKNFVHSLIGAARQEMISNPSPKLAALIRQLLAAKKQLSVNVNPRLVVDNAIV